MRIIQRKPARDIRKGDILLCEPPTKRCSVIVGRQLRRSAEVEEGDIWKRVHDVEVRESNGENPNQIFVSVPAGVPDSTPEAREIHQEWCYEDDAVYAIGLTQSEETFEALSGVITIID